MWSGRLGVDCLFGTSVALLDCHENWSSFEFVGCGILVAIRTCTLMSYVIMFMKYMHNAILFGFRRCIKLSRPDMVHGLIVPACT